MTKEELEKEAEEYRLSLATKLRPKLQEGCNCKELVDIEKAYLAGAEPREKQIQALGERCLQLQKDKGNLTDRVKELEMTVGTLRTYSNEQATCIERLEAQLEQEKNLSQCMSDHNEQLRELIQKMKCCYNCKHSRTEYEHCKTDKHEKWEIKEK